MVLNVRYILLCPISFAFISQTPLPRFAGTPLKGRVLFFCNRYFFILPKTFIVTTFKSKTRTLPLRGVRRSWEGCSFHTSSLELLNKTINIISQTPSQPKVGLPSREEFEFFVNDIFYVFKNFL